MSLKEGRDVEPVAKTFYVPALIVTNDEVTFLKCPGCGGRFSDTTTLRGYYDINKVSLTPVSINEQIVETCVQQKLVFTCPTCSASLVSIVSSYRGKYGVGLLIQRGDRELLDPGWYRSVDK